MVLKHRGVAQFGSAPALGAGCRRFESCHPDHEPESLTRVFCLFVLNDVAQFFFLSYRFLFFL